MQPHAIVLAVIALTGTLLVPHQAIGAPRQDMVSSRTHSASMFRPADMRMSPSDLPGKVSLIDTVTLGNGSCAASIPTNQPAGFLLNRQDWCRQGRPGSVLYQDFTLSSTGHTSQIGEWAASAYDTAEQARATFHAVESSLRLTQGCSAAANCGLASFQESVGVMKPDGTMAPTSTRNVLYSVWSSGNIVAEVAVVYDSAQSAVRARSYRNSMIRRGAELVQQLLSGNP